MAKTILKKEMICINFLENTFRFYRIEVLSVGYNQLQIITNYGTLGNKGRENIIRLQDLKEARKIAYQKIYQKKAEGFVNQDKVIPTIHSLFNINQKAKAKTPSKPGYCGRCKAEIAPALYSKINEWGRGEGKWDVNAQSPAYKKVLCIDCQIELDLFKKRGAGKK